MKPNAEGPCLAYYRFLRTRLVFPGVFLRFFGEETVTSAPLWQNMRRRALPRPQAVARPSMYISSCQFRLPMPPFTLSERDFKSKRRAETIQIARDQERLVRASAR